MSDSGDGPQEADGEPSGFVIELRKSGDYELPNGVVAALEQLEAALVEVEADTAEVSGFGYKPQLRIGELMPKLTIRGGGLALTCTSEYEGTGPDGTGGHCKTTFTFP